MTKSKKPVKKCDCSGVALVVGLIVAVLAGLAVYLSQPSLKVGECFRKIGSDKVLKVTVVLGDDLEAIDIHAASRGYSFLNTYNKYEQKELVALECPDLGKGGEQESER